MQTCENCGSIVYSLGCTNCEEENYIEEQDQQAKHWEYRKSKDFPGKLIRGDGLSMILDKNISCCNLPLDDYKRCSECGEQC